MNGLGLMVTPVQINNPTILTATETREGSYSVVATVLGCPSIASTTNVVNPVPTTPTTEVILLYVQDQQLI